MPRLDVYNKSLYLILRGYPRKKNLRISMTAVGLWLFVCLFAFNLDRAVIL